MKRPELKSILIIGAGPIVIGQACEFDYSGSQACRALRAEGHRVILVNSNPATIMTDPEMADVTYVEPLNEQTLERVIAKERPNAILPTLGGQTGLNLGMRLHQTGVLERHGVEMIGAKPEAIHKAEDRHEFRKAMDRIGLESARSRVAYDLNEAKRAALELGYPCVVRSAYTLGGAGGGVAHDEGELMDIVASGLRNSLISEVLIEESVLGWKEFELEVMRDVADNVVIICSIENLDPMGVHTGDSITVAPAQTLTDVEYQKMRNATLAIMREIGVETGGSNVQFAVHPETGRMIVIEMNPRVSRSSALASKATGFPIAKFAAKLAVGYRLDEIMNDITGKTPACFEPTIDYVVTKIPRFNFEKFPGSQPFLGTSMKSVGEVMAIGRTFKESLQKGLRSMENKRAGMGFDGRDFTDVDLRHLIERLRRPNPDRLHYIKLAFEHGLSVDQVYLYTGIDPWFLHQIREIVEAPRTLEDDEEGVRRAKELGFSDPQLARIWGYPDEDALRRRREELGVRPVYKIVDTCAGEFEASTPYYYSTYEHEDEVRSTRKRKVMIIGGGPNRIGQGIEFDYCCVHASYAAKEMGYLTIMVNSNPETVSTDFDTSDKLYFEPLTLEDVLNIHDKEKPEGVIVQFGGQTPLNLALALERHGVRILGTDSDGIDRAEDRKRFKELLLGLGLRQPENAAVSSVEEAPSAARRIGYPVIVRPSYVLGGAAMDICTDEDELMVYMHNAKDVSPQHPILIDRYLSNATEVDVDALGDGKDCVIVGIMEHVEEAGIHSGDSACYLPPYRLEKSIIDEIRMATKALSRELKIIGLINIQFAVKDGELYVLEVNPRASRTVPFVSKAVGIPWAKMATRVLLGATIADLGLTESAPPYWSVKEAVLPWSRFSATDPILGPEMRSTGEVMGLDRDRDIAFWKAAISAGQRLPAPGATIGVFAETDATRRALTDVLHPLEGAGYSLVDLAATLAADLPERDVEALAVQGAFDLLVSIPLKRGSRVGPLLRRAAVKIGIPIVTTVRGAERTVAAMIAVLDRRPELLSLQERYRETQRNGACL